MEGGGGDGRDRPKDRAKPPEKWDDGLTAANRWMMDLA